MLPTKLPHVGTTIFSQMSALAQQHDAINLSQGFPEFDGPELLKRKTQEYIQNGMNQYAPMPGVLPLREQIKELIFRCYQRDVSADTDITVTSGATEALFVAIQAVVQPGDEVIVFDPAYDSYDPAITLAGGVPVHLELTPGAYRIDWNALNSAINERTKAIVINTPHNPSATCLSYDDLSRLEALVCDNELFLISDEVYEHITFDGILHQSVHRFERLAARSFIVSSFGKTYHMTGWKLGYCVAPKNLSTEFRKIHQYVTFSSFTPAQLALADVMMAQPDHCSELGYMYQDKRDLFNQLMENSRFKLLPSSGSYFVLADYSDISDLPDTEFCIWLTENAGVAAIPMSVFFASGRDDKVIRFCFAKRPHTLKEAAKRLGQL
ncbi:methionine aminotransferase [Pleionea sp. CnH1-48]|uniref:methionine aminotransferase n=1 Tax=Pleionea sp. CnH1-48 TaxID=2954494 RepID=UPI0020985025|nr:methionine aminotransferase [Pleionea sp. CnH1-48]MCO7223424.1 methionine aminotransferase [Pleionea sp. CnH1-48]